MESQCCLNQCSLFTFRTTLQKYASHLYKFSLLLFNQNDSVRQLILWSMFAFNICTEFLLVISTNHQLKTKFNCWFKTHFQQKALSFTLQDTQIAQKSISYKFSHKMTYNHRPFPQQESFQDWAHLLPTPKLHFRPCLLTELSSVNQITMVGSVLKLRVFSLRLKIFVLLPHIASKLLFEVQVRYCLTFLQDHHSSFHRPSLWPVWLFSLIIHAVWHSLLTVFKSCLHQF